MGNQCYTFPSHIRYYIRYAYVKNLIHNTGCAWSILPIEVACDETATRKILSQWLWTSKWLFPEAYISW